MTRPGAAPDTSSASQDEENAAVTAICHPQIMDRPLPFHIFNIRYLYAATIHTIYFLNAFSEQILYRHLFHVFAYTLSKRSQKCKSTYKIQ